MATAGAVARLQKEYRDLLKEPLPLCQAHPNPTNLLEWHYVLQGPAATDYAGGVYHGIITFPGTYPWKPPSIKMLTPNGRFAENSSLCLSFSSWHPELWNPLWSVGTILNGTLSFMLEEAPAAGCIQASKAQRRQLAAQSLAHNCRNKTFCMLFPDYADMLQQGAACLEPSCADVSAGKQQDGRIPSWLIAFILAGAALSIILPLWLQP